MMIDVVVPLEQEGTQAKILDWMVKVGDRVEVNDPLVELETDKVTMELPAPVAGTIAEILLEKGAEAVPGTIVARIRKGAAVTAAPQDAPAAVAPKPAAAEERHSPAVRRALSETGVDPSTVSGTGKGGRLTRADVVAAAEKAPVTSAPQAAAPPKQPAPSASGSRDVPHDSMRLAIAANMVRSMADAPQVTAVFEADFSAIMAHRKKHKPAFAADGINLSYTAYIVDACAKAMAAAPSVNSKWHADRLELFGNVNIGIGTALGEKGLVVPVIQRVQDLSLKGIASRLQDLTERARSRALKPADMSGGTFTISNHGVSGSLLASPVILHQGQSGILGVGKLEKRVVVREVDGQDTIQIRPMAYVTLTIDHRVVDGFQTNGWLSAFVAALEEWKP